MKKKAELSEASVCVLDVRTSQKAGIFMVHESTVLTHDLLLCEKNNELRKLEKKIVLERI